MHKGEETVEAFFDSCTILILHNLILGTFVSSKPTTMLLLWMLCPPLPLDILHLVCSTAVSAFLPLSFTNDTSETVPEPDFSKPVFFRALRDCPQVILPE